MAQQEIKEQAKKQAKSVLLEEQKVEDRKIEALQKENQVKRLEKIRQQRDYRSEINAQASQNKHVLNEIAKYDKELHVKQQNERIDSMAYREQE